ncbi:uncharacterized protein V6R79_002646 [Siganus canaliculatus]
MQDDTNRESVAAIESSILTLCLDGAMPPVDEDQKHITPILQMMHGGGSRWNSGNRWFDKGLQIIAAEDGTCGINGCHAVADGLTALFFTDLTLENMKKLQVMHSSTEPLPLPKKLHFNITPEIQKDIEEAKQHLDMLVKGLVVTVTRFNHFGKDILKALKTSPDSFIQLAIQLAYYRLHQCCCPTVEPITLSLFSRGRLGFINSNTKASGAFVKAFDDPNKQSSEKVRLLEEAVKAHKWFIQMGLSGQVTEAHLFGLKMQAAEQNIPVPEIFTDPSYTKAFDFQVFTSQCPSQTVVDQSESVGMMMMMMMMITEVLALQRRLCSSTITNISILMHGQVTSKTGCVPCNGPEGADTLSVVYGVQKDHINFTVSCWEPSRTNAARNVYQMFQALQDALLEMKMLLETAALQDTKTLQDQTPKAKLTPLTSPGEDCTQSRYTWSRYTWSRLHLEQTSSGADFTWIRLHLEQTSPGADYTWTRLHLDQTSPGADFIWSRLHLVPLHLGQTSPGADYTWTRLHLDQTSPGADFIWSRLYLEKTSSGPATPGPDFTWSRLHLVPLHLGQTSPGPDFTWTRLHLKQTSSGGDFT